MLIDECTLDDLLHNVYSTLLAKQTVYASSKGSFKETIGAHLRLSNPLARLSMSESRLKATSALGELLWYLAGSDDPAFITHYVARYERFPLQDGKMPGAYGPRIFGSPPHDQFANIIKLLTRRPSSRRAVMQLFDAKDLEISMGQDLGNPLEVPCTCTMQFLVRDEQLHLIVHMRSCDAYFGLPHDVFCFTMLQEVLARTIGVSLGSYTHLVGSLHLYEDAFEGAKSYLQEGWQQRIAMPPMPEGDQANSIRRLLDAERMIRLDAGKPIWTDLPLYWRELGVLIEVHAELKCKRRPRSEVLSDARSRVSLPALRQYFLDRIT